MVGTRHMGVVSFPLEKLGLWIERGESLGKGGDGNVGEIERNGDLDFIFLARSRPLGAAKR